MAKSSIKVTTTKTKTKVIVKTPKGAGKKGNPNKCPVCGKFTGKNA